MKKISTLISAPLLALLVAANVHAVENKAAALKPATTESQQNKQPQQPQQNQQAKMPKSIDQVLSIKTLGREMVINDKGQALALFKFTITNIGELPISSIEWLGAYVNKRQVVYSQDMQINMQAPLMPNASFNINFQIPFLQIEEKHRAVFMDSQSQIKVFPIDRRIQFANKQSLSD
ncbi:MAG: hypothetical protein KH899_01510 [Haemophilus pittmaniae]|uniref:hypothetical protein n=1 Tax=Haemophilus pittmaniae TaxID=249188 RepID=UPI0023F2F6C7|nr:hypothetical protein [Haemophilus pittmaniae]MBS6026276.1 hypothetical protein [Haemophilus pittmaniae]